MPSLKTPGAPSWLDTSNRWLPYIIHIHSFGFSLSQELAVDEPRGLSFLGNSTILSISRYPRICYKHTFCAGALLMNHADKGRKDTCFTIITNLFNHCTSFFNNYSWKMRLEIYWKTFSQPFFQQFCNKQYSCQNCETHIDDWNQPKMD